MNRLAGAVATADRYNLIMRSSVAFCQRLFWIVAITACDRWRKRMKRFRIGRKRVAILAGESMRVVRELQGSSQHDLVSRIGMPQRPGL